VVAPAASAATEPPALWPATVAIPGPATAAEPLVQPAQSPYAAHPWSNQAQPLAERAPPQLPLPLPPILLEGDEPSSAAPATGPGGEYVPGPGPPAEPLEPEAAELPEAYGTGTLLLTAREPHWLYAHWDLAREEQRRCNALAADQHLILRVYEALPSGPAVPEVHVLPESQHWFVQVPHADTKYMAELGYYRPGGQWVKISISDVAATPPDSLAQEKTVQLATIEPVRGAPPAAEARTPAPGRALAAASGREGVWEEGASLAELMELRQHQLAREMGSQAAAELGLPFPVGGGPGITSPGGAPAQPRRFWFDVNAELVVYGATEPDARVTIGGRPIRLRPDGSFSYRFALPDGSYELVVAAASAHHEWRQAGLRFSRRTEYRGEVGDHPLDVSLKPPSAENVA